MSLNFGNIKDDLYRMVGVRSTTARADIIDAVYSAIQRAQEAFCQARNWGFLEQITDRVYIPLQAPYTTGTVTVTQDSKTITGAGTTWTRDMEGSFFSLDNKAFYEIRSFVSTTSLTLAIPYQDDNAAGETYSILKRFYPLPLDFVKPSAVEAKLMFPGTNSENVVAYSRNASFVDQIQTGVPRWFSVIGNTRRTNYYDTGTATIATTANLSTATINAGSLPDDIVDREFRVRGESNGYFISVRNSSAAMQFYNPYVNPLDQTSAISAATYAITPKETLLIGFSHIPDQRYVFAMPYIKRIPDMLLDSDVSPIILAGHSDAFLALCREKLARDARTAQKADQVASLVQASSLAMDEAWCNEQMGETQKLQGSVARPDRIQVGPSWMNITGGTGGW